MAQANLEGVGSNPGFDAKPTRQMSMDQADAEDARLNRMRILQDQKLDYAELTSRILKSTGF